MPKLTLPHNLVKRHKIDSDKSPHIDDGYLPHFSKSDEKITHNSSVEELLNEIERQKEIIKL